MTMFGYITTPQIRFTKATQLRVGTKVWHNDPRHPPQAPAVVIGRKKQLLWIAVKFADRPSRSIRLVAVYSLEPRATLDEFDKVE